MLTKLIILVVLAFVFAVFFALQERWSATKSLLLGAAFPITIPVALYFMGRKWWVDRKRVKEYARQADVTKELNDTYVPKDHVEVNPNFTDINPFEVTPSDVLFGDVKDLNAAYNPDTDVGEIEIPVWAESVGVAIGESMIDGGKPYICPFHRKYPNVPYSGCTCHK